jgi:serine/threonine protein kinase
MATVYKGYDPQLERVVAIKVILQQEDHSEMFLTRFKREAKTLARLSHPNIVKVLDYGEQDGQPFLVMDYIAGGNLASSEKLPVHWRRAAELLLPVAHSLHLAHLNGIVHRDVKPSNILISDSGTPMLSDFGIAKMLEYHETIDLTQDGVGIGTPEYMAPEQSSGEGSGPRVDIYALGVVFFELVTGTRPFTADTPLAVVLKHHNQPLPPPRKFVPDLPEDVERFIYKILAKDPDQRYTDMNAVAAVLEKIAGASLTRVEAPQNTLVFDEPIRQPKEKLAWWPNFAGFGELAFLALTIFTVFAFVQNNRQPRIITITGGYEATPAVDFASVSGVTGQVEVVAADGAVVPIEDQMNLRVGGSFRLKSTDGQARLNLVDGSTLCIPPTSEVIFHDVSPEKSDQPEFRLSLVAGGLLFIDSPEKSSSFLLESPGPLTVRSRGAVIGLEKNETGNILLDLDCLDGSCTFESKSGQVDVHAPGSFWLMPDGKLVSSGPPSSEAWASVCADLTGDRVKGIPTPTQPNTLFHMFSDWIDLNVQPSATRQAVMPAIMETTAPNERQATPIPENPASPTPSPAYTDQPISTATWETQPTATSWDQPTPTPLVTIAWLIQPTATSPSITPSPTNPVSATTAPQTTATATQDPSTPAPPTPQPSTQTAISHTGPAPRALTQSPKLRK